VWPVARDQKWRGRVPVSTDQARPQLGQFPSSVRRPNNDGEPLFARIADALEYRFGKNSYEPPGCGRRRNSETDYSYSNIPCTASQASLSSATLSYNEKPGLPRARFSYLALAVSPAFSTCRCLQPALAAQQFPALVVCGGTWILIAFLFQ